MLGGPSVAVDANYDTKMIAILKNGPTTAGSFNGSL